MEILDEKKPEYAKLQAVLTETETALEALARKHPEWFVTKRSIKTPFGTVKLTKSSKLSVKNEELAIVLIEQAIEQANLRGEVHEFDKLLRTRKELDLEALEKLDEVVLKKFRIERVSFENFSVVPAVVDMGKAVKEAVEKEAA